MMLALLTAATISAPPPANEPPRPAASQTAVMTNLYHQPANCGPIVQGEIARQQVALKGRRPAAEYAVERRLDGCSVPTPVGYHPGYLVDGAAVAAPSPKREDAPSNKR